MTMSQERSMDQLGTGLPALLQLGVDGGTKLYRGSFAAPLTATGMLAVGGGVASCNSVAGIAAATVDNTAGSDGDLSVDLLQGAFRRKNSATSALDATYVCKPCYAEDGETVRAASGANYPLAGIFLGFEADGTTPVVFVSAAFTNTDITAAIAAEAATLAGITAGTGGNLVGYDDSGSKTTAATVADALDELYVDATTAQACLEVPLANFMLAAGTPLAAYSADPTPGYALADSKARCIKWGSHATPTAIWGSCPVPNDLLDTAAMNLHILASKSGATLADATTFTCAAFFQTVGAAHDADADCGGASSAMVGDAVAKTVAELTLAIAHGDVPPAPANLSFSMKPTDGLLGTDDIYVHRVWFEYTRKIMTS